MPAVMSYMGDVYVNEDIYADAVRAHLVRVGLMCEAPERPITCDVSVLGVHCEESDGGG